MKLKLLSTAAAATALTIGIAGSPAQADGSYTQYFEDVYVGETWAGRAGFKDAGDHILVSDKQADGLRAVTEWKTDYGRSGTCHDDDGADNGDIICNYDMSESAKVNFRVVLRNGANGANQYASSWNGWVPISYSS